MFGALWAVLQERLPRRVVQSLMASASELLPVSSSFLFHLLLIYTFDIIIVSPVACYHQNLSEDQTSLCGQQRKPEDRPQMAREFRRLRGVLLHTLSRFRLLFSRASRGRDAIVLTALWVLHPQWPPVHSGSGASVPHICTCHVHTHGCWCSSPASVK